MRDVLAGAALGALVGLLVGLTTSEVVGMVVGALVALLASFFGLRGEGGPLPAAGPARIAGFSVAAVGFLLLGLHLRATDALAPGLEDRAGAWKAVGFDVADAAMLTAFERLGVVRGDWRAPNGAIEAAKERGGRLTTALFAGEAAESCHTLLGRDYPDAKAYEAAFRAEGAPWTRFAEAVPDGLADAERRAVFAAGVALVCEEAE